MNIFKVLVTLTMFFIINYCDDDIENLKNCILKLSEYGFSPDNAFFNRCYVNQFGNKGKYDIREFETYLKPVLPKNYDIKDIVNGFYYYSTDANFNINDSKILLTPEKYCSTLNVSDVDGCANSIKTNDYFTDNKYSNAVKTYKYNMKILYNDNKNKHKDMNNNNINKVADFIVYVKPGETILIVKSEDLIINKKNEDIIVNIKKGELIVNVKNKDPIHNDNHRELIFNVHNRDIILNVEPGGRFLNLESEDIKVNVKPGVIFVNVKSGDYVVNINSGDILVNVKPGDILVYAEAGEIIPNNSEDIIIINFKPEDILVYAEAGEVIVNVKAEDFNFSSNNEENMWENTDVFTELQKKYYEFLSNMLNDHKEYIQDLKSTEWCKKNYIYYNNGVRNLLFY